MSEINRSSFRRWGGTLAVAVIALLAASAAYAWSSSKYVDTESVPAGYGRFEGGTYSREFNKVWRPTPHYFCVHYQPGSPPGNICSVWDNPVVDNRNAFQVDAHCDNNDDVSSYPVTCLTTRP
ncbi:MAG: hypothetical protein WKF65_10635 [Gaiellaceae bacterium]